MGVQMNPTGTSLQKFEGRGNCTEMILEVATSTRYLPSHS